MARDESYTCGSGRAEAETREGDVVRLSPFGSGRAERVSILEWKY